MPTAREWEDPKVVPANEIAKWMDEGWEPCGACMMPATNTQTGAQTAIVAYCIRRKFSPVRAVIEGAHGRVAGARVVVPINGSR